MKLFHKEPVPMKNLIITTFFVSLILAQENNYTIMSNEDSIGYFSIKKTLSKDTITYKAHSVFAFSFFGDRFVDQTSHSTYISNKLELYNMTSDQNGELFHSEIIKRHYGYSVSINTRKTEMLGRLPKNIQNGIIALYFSEPVKLKHVFSENSGEYVSIKKIKEHSYTFSVNGNDWIFYYKNGIVHKAHFDGIFDFTFHLKK
jgi:hypothetical protein